MYDTFERFQIQTLLDLVIGARNCAVLTTVFCFKRPARRVVKSRDGC